MIKAFTTIIPKHIVCSCIGFQTRSMPLIYQNESNTFCKLFLLKSLFPLLQILRDSGSGVSYRYLHRLELLRQAQEKDGNSGH